MACGVRNRYRRAHVVTGGVIDAQGCRGSALAPSEDVKGNAMNRITRAGLVSLLPVVLVGTACSTAAVGSGTGAERVALRPGADAVPTTAGPLPTAGPPTAVTAVPNLPSLPPTAPPVTAPVPTVAQSFVPLQDDTGMLSVEVPASWVDVDTRPFVNEDGTLRPGISAATSLAAFDDDWNAPGLVYTAFNFEPDPNVLFGRYDYTQFCTDGGFAPYNDGVFVGYARTFTECADVGSTNIVIVANAPGNTVTIVLIIQVVTADDHAAYQRVLETFNIDPSVGMPTETVPPQTTTPLPTTPVPTAAVPTVAPTTPPLPTSPLLTVPPTSSPGGKRNAEPRVG